MTATLGRPSNPYQLDAEAWGKQCVEIITRRKFKLWSQVFTSTDEESAYVAWAARWAFHWAARA